MSSDKLSVTEQVGNHPGADVQTLDVDVPVQFELTAVLAKEKPRLSLLFFWSPAR